MAHLGTLVLHKHMLHYYLLALCASQQSVSCTCYANKMSFSGKLSHWLQLALSCENNVHYVLVDRASVRRKVCTEGLCP